MLNINNELYNKLDKMCDEVQQSKEIDEKAVDEFVDEVYEYQKVEIKDYIGTKEDIKNFVMYWLNHAMANDKDRVNAWLTAKAYREISNIMRNNGKLGSMKLSKGVIISIGICLISQSLDVGENFENLVIQALEGGYL